MHRRQSCSGLVHHILTHQAASIAFIFVLGLVYHSTRTCQARHYSSSLVQKEEVDALLQFKAHLSPPSQAMLRGWHANNTLSICDGIDSWVGVTCNHHHRIRAINLTHFGLVGTLAPDLGNLSALSALNLQSNFFTSVIPPQLSGCSSLQDLNLAINNLTGPIPSSLSSLSSLQLLNLGGNNLNGQIPQSLFANYTSLIILGLSLNAFTGSIPDLPTSLNELLLADNNFTGDIPRSLGNCTNLVIIQIIQNQLTNQIPTEIGFLTNLRILYLQENNLEGAIPHTVGNLTSLTDLETSSNHLTGPIPPELGLLGTSLGRISLDYNFLTGTIPRSLGNCSHLRAIELLYNQLTGPIPTEFGLLTGLQWLNLAKNNLTGAIPSSLGNCTNLSELILLYNKLSGIIPTELSQLVHLTDFHLASNKLSGHLTLLNPSNSTSLLSFLVGMNELTGSIPADLGKLPQLQQLSLGSNQFSNSIPWESFSNCTSLYFLDLSYNQLTGQLSSIMFTRLYSLREVLLQDNQLQGEIPKFEASNKITLLTLDVSFNQLNGSLPSSLAHLLSTGIKLDLSYNDFSGSLPSWLGQLVNMQIMLLSHNQFTGAIPESMGSCVALTFIDLSYNHLSGGFPLHFSNLTYLQYLDLSSNNLTGMLPSFIEKFDNLSFFNVSFNNLSGSIPGHGVFKHLNSSSFQGNPHLCGTIIQKPCILSSNYTQINHKHHHNLLFKWKVTALTLVIVSIVASIVLAMQYYSRRNPGVSMEYLKQRGANRSYTAKELIEATESYSERNIIGQGGLSTVYKGLLSDGKTIAVKRFKELMCSRESLMKEVEILSKLRHRNLVRILGCVTNLDVNALVLEYMPNGSLENYLYHEEHELKDWFKTLIQIIIGIANSLTYLHYDYGVPIVHGDVKPSNILLDSEFEAHLADFGLAKLSKEGAFSVSSNFKGSIGYMAPEFAYGTRITTKVDVYSFGIVLLEMLTGRGPTSLPDGLSLHNLVKQKLLDSVELVELLNASLVQSLEESHNDNDTSSSLNYNHVALQLLRMGVECTGDHPDNRPTMQEISHSLCRFTLVSNEKGSADVAPGHPLRAAPGHSNPQVDDSFHTT